MENIVIWIGRLGGLVGVLMCVAALALRAGGDYWLGGIQLGTLLQGGIAAMVLACLCHLVVLTERQKSRP